MVTNAVPGTVTNWLSVDDSPELRQHPELDRLVLEHRTNALALAAYVQNEIRLVDAISFGDSGSVGDQAVNHPGVARGALGVLLERQGNPLEQCALLVYLLRRCGLPASYVFAPDHGVKLLDTRLSRALRMQVRGAVNDRDNSYATNTLISVNYPWVATKVGANWVHLFPWLKDTELIEGFDLYDFMPTNALNGYQWLQRYSLRDTEIFGLSADSEAVSDLFPKYVEKWLLANAPGVSLDDIGVRLSDRRLPLARWEDFPRPTWVTNGAVSVARDLTTVTNVFPNWTNIFDTLSVEVSTVSAPIKTIATTDMRLVDIHNRRLVIRHSVTNGSTVLMNMSLAPFRPGITNVSAFGADATWLNRQLVSNVLSSTHDGLSVLIRNKRLRHISAGTLTNLHWNVFLGLSEQTTNEHTFSIRKGDAAAVVFSLGRMTPEMVQVHLREFWDVQRQIAVNPSLTNSVDPDIAITGIPHLAGLSYLNRVGRFQERADEMLKVTASSWLYFGLSTFDARHHATTGVLELPLKLDHPGLDLVYSQYSSAGNGSLRPDLGNSRRLAQEDYWALQIAEGSVQEHLTLESFYGKPGAISTMRLLWQALQPAQPGIWRLNIKNYNSYLSAINSYDPAMAATISEAFSSSTWKWGNPDYVQAIVTQSPVTSSEAAYQGMGALIYGNGRSGALISGNGLPRNGGVGPVVTTTGANADNVTDRNVRQNNGGDVTATTLTSSSPLPGTYTPSEASSIWTRLFVSSLWLDPYYADVYGAARTSPGGNNRSNADIYADSVNNGGIDSASVGLWSLPSWQSVVDPVDIVTGRFLVSTTDLTLPGPFPLSLQRNYDSQRLDVGEMRVGVGWRLNYLPYLRLTDTNLIYAAEADGTVVAYRKVSGGGECWRPTPTDNPELSNAGSQGAGGVGNLFLSWITNVVESGATNYYLRSGGGEVRKFTLQAYPAPNDPILSRARPYLQTWQDARGNSLRLVYGNDASQPEYGQPWLIESSNGNLLGFRYNHLGQVLEAYTLDGRRVRYEYDGEGDLRGVSFPDQSEVRYDYLRLPETYTAASAFGSVQGPTWSYHRGSGTTFTQLTTFALGSTHWSGGHPDHFYWGGAPSDTFCLVGGERHHPGSTYDSVRSWKAPHAGTISISSRVVGPGSGSDGVKVRILKNTTEIATWQTVLSGSSLSLNISATSVASNDWIHFVVNRNGSSTNDWVSWLPTISYANGTTFSTHLLTRETKPDGRVLENYYDHLRRVTNQAATVGPDLRLVTNATFVYDNNTESLLKLPVSGTNWVLDVFGRTNRYDISENRITKITSPDGLGVTYDWFEGSETNKVGYYPRSLESITDRRGLLTSYQYDTNGNVTKLTYLGNLTGGLSTTETSQTTAQYDGRNLPVYIVDRTGVRTDFLYDANRVLTNAVSSKGGVSFATNAFALTNVSEVLSLGSATWTNQSFGLVWRAVRGSSATNDTQFDGRGWPATVTRHARSPGTPGNSDPAVSLILIQNDRGELIEQIDAAGRRQRMGHDPAGRPQWREVFENGAGVPFYWEQSFYNENGETIWSDGPKYNPEDYVWRDYDGAGRKVSEVRWRTRAKADGKGVEAIPGEENFAISSLSYDAYGNLLRVTGPLGHYQSFAYDKLDRKTNEVMFEVMGGIATALATNSFTYEPGHQVASETSPIGGVTRIYYNSLGQTIRRENPDGSTNRFTYELDGRLKREYQVNDAYWETIYDDANRKVTRQFRNSGGTLLATEVKEFDARGNLIKLTDAAGSVFTSTFDGLDRIKTTSGPATSGSSAQQVTTFTYDASGKITRSVNALGQETVTETDALGRVVKTEVKATVGGAVVRVTTNTDTPDHHGVVTTSGAGTGAVTTIRFSDTFGNPVLTQFNPTNQFTLQSYDAGGSLVSSRDELGQVTTFGYDGLGRVAWRSLPDGATNRFLYNPAGQLIRSTLPGNLKWRADFDSAGREKGHWLEESGGTVTRAHTNTYYTSGAVGRLQSSSDGRGIIFTHSYDAWLRLTNRTAGSFLIGYEYDLLGRAIVVQQTSGGVVTRVDRQYDRYSQVQNETVSFAGALVSSLGQGWDGAGRRTRLRATAFPLIQGTGQGDDVTFGYRADGLLTAVTQGPMSATYGYANNGLMTGRTNGWRHWSVVQRDTRGRLTQASTKVNGTTVLAETLNWRANSTIDDYTADRAGAGTWDETRDYAYNSRGQLTGETFKPSSPGSATYTFGYDTGKLGVRTSANLSGGTLGNTWSGGTPNGFGRLTSETLGLSQWFLTARGRAPGAATVALTLDGVVKPTIYSADSPAGDWFAPLGFGSGSHTLIATATHPFNGATNYLTKTTNTFTAAGSGTIAVTYDGNGNVLTRTWSGTNAKSHALGWDELGRLVRVTERFGTSTNLVWTVDYDGVGRRWRVVETRFVAGIANSSVATESWYDPQVEFLEVAVNHGGERWWKLHGPDLNGVYGSLQGIGGLEGAVRESDGEAEGSLNDHHGHGIATVSGLTVRWEPTQVVGYGPVLGYDAPRLSHVVTPMQAALWRGKRMDAAGYYWLGARYYDPVGGKFLSADPMGHGASWSLYDYAGNDPVNSLDPDGRFGKQVFNYAYNGGAAGEALRGIGGYLDNYQTDNPIVGALSGYYGSLANSLGGMVTPANYVNSAVNFGGTVNTLYHEDGALAATSYALTSWNVGSIYEGVANMDVATGQEVGSWDQRGVRITSGVANTAGLALGGARVMTVSGVTAPLENFAARTYLNMVDRPNVYASAVEGTSRLNIEFGGRQLFRAANSEGAAAFGEFASIERPPTPAAAIQGSALSPAITENRAAQLFQVTTRPGFSVQGTVAAQGVGYPGGYTQVFQVSRNGLPTWSSVQPVEYLGGTP